jgi:hypothetical protein
VNGQRKHREVFAACLILIALFVAWHVVPALVVKDDPPLACQLDGGQWSIWTGWTCR